MNSLALAAVLSGGVMGAAAVSEAPGSGNNAIVVVSKDARSSGPGSPANFTGHAQVEQLFGARAASRMTGGIVTFQPGARSVWHTHPVGQILIVTDGSGLVQQWGSPVHPMKTGDVVWIPAGVKHWHGAAATTAVTHIALQEIAGGKVVDWLEPVTDAQYGSPERDRPPPSTGVEQVSPALAAYTESKLRGEVWKRGDLSARDRSVVTVAALIARNQTVEMSHHFKLALDHGVTPAELSEIIFHLAFYAGWPNAMAAAMVAREEFRSRGIEPRQLPAVSPKLLPLEPMAEEKRAARVAQDVGPVSRGLVDYTGSLLFHDLWLRPDLAPRDRSLVTFSALVAAGQSAQIAFHLNKAMDNGLTRAQASEVLTHLAFYVGWPNAMSAVPVVKTVFDARPNDAQHP